jgi:hypothetical protein
LLGSSGDSSWRNIEVVEKSRQLHYIDLHTPGRTITSENWESYIQQFQYYCLQNLVGKLRFAIFDLPFFLLVVRNGLKGFDVPVDVSEFHLLDAF